MNTGSTGANEESRFVSCVGLLTFVTQTQEVPKFTFWSRRRFTNSVEAARIASVTAGMPKPNSSRLIGGVTQSKMGVTCADSSRRFFTRSEAVAFITLPISWASRQRHLSCEAPSSVTIPAEAHYMDGSSPKRNGVTSFRRHLSRRLRALEVRFPVVMTTAERNNLCGSKS
jgi:hypothetical protein